MEIYITDVLPIILKDKLTNIKDQDNNVIKPEKKLKQEIFSEEFGLHVIQNNNIKWFEPNFKPIYEIIKKYNNHTLLVNVINNCQIKCVSQLPVEYVLTHVIQLEYKMNIKSKLTLIIECIDDKKGLESILIPINFYFYYNDKNPDIHDLLSNIFFQDEFNMFLSQLN